MLKFCLTVDCERFISFKQQNPKWSWFGNLKKDINSMIKNFRYNEKGFELVYNIVKKQEFPCTFMLVGKLFKPLGKKDFIEWGYHSFNHVPLTLISDEKLEKEVKNIYDCKSFTAPMWMIEDVKSPERIFNILKKQGFTHVVYRGQDDGVKRYGYDFFVKKPEKRYGINCIWLSNCFEGNSSKQHIQEVKKDILNNIDKEGIYLLSTHDFTHKNSKNLLEIIRFIKKLEKENKIKSQILSKC